MNKSSFVEVKIENISLSNLGFIVFLKHPEDENVLPICIGAMEAHSIAACYNNQSFPRPLSHDLFKGILKNLNCKITRIHVTDLIDGTFYARIFILAGSTELDVDSRPSDAIALALRFDAPIYVHTDVLKAASVNLDKDKEAVEESVDPIQKLKDDLKKAVAAERYEDAAKIRDELKLKTDKN
jgi:bifunctional DNase/RNase